MRLQPAFSVGTVARIIEICRRRGTNMRRELVIMGLTIKEIAAAKRSDKPYKLTDAAASFC